ncbi:large conductance mechanosensitive channel protein MscL [Candidatus Micrarchaeota archaeon]|nr:large conductance mechanosensitive channel protein MscL [Candidatus Micrarchaeota archaeon]
MGIMREFRGFLEEYKVLGLAVAFVMGAAVNEMVKSLVDNMIMPVVEVIIPGGSWQTATATIGPVTFGWGPFLAALIYFTIIALVVFLIAKMVMKEEKVKKK